MPRPIRLEAFEHGKFLNNLTVCVQGLIEKCHATKQMHKLLVCQAPSFDGHSENSGLVHVLYRDGDYVNTVCLLCKEQHISEITGTLLIFFLRTHYCTFSANFCKYT